MTYRRNRTLTQVVASALLLLTLTTGWALRQYGRAQEESEYARIANADAQEESERARRAEDEAIAEKERAEANEVLALSNANDARQQAPPPSLDSSQRTAAMSP